MKIEPIQGSSCSIFAQKELVDNTYEEFLLFLRELGIEAEGIAQWEKVFKSSVQLAIDKTADSTKQIETRWCSSDKRISLEVLFESTGNGVGSLLDEVRLHCKKADFWSHEGRHRLVCESEHPEIAGMDLGDELINSTMEELSSCYESLSAFYKLGDALLSSENIVKFIEKVLSNLGKVVDSDHLTLAFIENFEPSLKKELEAMSCYKTVDLERSPQENELLKRGDEFVWETLEEIENNEDLKGYGCGICCQIKAVGKTLGVLTLARTSNTPYLNSGELNTIRTFTDLFGIAIAQTNNAIIREKSLRAVSELEIASDIQKSLLPVPALPEGTEWKLFAERKSALEVAGDYVDACFDKKGGIYLIIIDVMGKGVPAAFLAAMMRTAFHINLNFSYTLSGLVHALNRIVSQQVNDITIFATCSIAYIPRDRKTIEIVNAGHCPPIVIKNDTEMIEIEASGPPMGLFEDAEYKVEKYALDKGDKLLMITDGLYEWETGEHRDEIWGWENFIDYLKESKHLEEPKELWDDLQEKIKVAEQGEAPSDDQTFIYWKLCQ